MFEFFTFVTVVVLSFIIVVMLDRFGQEIVSLIDSVEGKLISFGIIRDSRLDFRHYCNEMSSLSYKGFTNGINDTVFVPMKSGRVGVYTTEWADPHPSISAMHTISFKFLGYK